MTNSKPTIVLVPGSWHLPSCFDPFSKCLNDKGYETTSVTLPSVLRNGQTPVSSHHEDVAVIRKHVEDLIVQNKQVVVFSHSYGGFPTTEALSGLGATDRNAPGTLRLIFCSAFIPQEGQIAASFSTDPELSPGLPAHFSRLSEDKSTCYLIDEHMFEAFYHDVDRKVAEEVVIPQLGAQSVASWLSPVTKCAYREIPSSYIVCTEDRSVLPWVQRKIAERAGIKDCVEIEGSHCAFLSRPDELAGIVDAIVRRS